LNQGGLMNYRRHEFKVTNRLVEIFCLLTALTLFSCKGGEVEIHDTESDLTQLTQRRIACKEYSKTEIETRLASMPSQFIRSNTWRDSDLARAKNALAGIPTEYMDWLYSVHQKNRFAISQRNLGSGTMGVTYFGSLPTRIDISTSRSATDFALQHEIGHAVHVKFRRTNGFQSDLSGVFRTEGRSRLLRSYARTSSAEYFAESFNNYYCGKESHNFIKTNLPNTYAFLQKYLKAPNWEASSLFKKDIFLKILSGTNPSSPDLLIASSTDYSKIILCEGTVDECLKYPTETVSFTELTRNNSNRKFFRSNRNYKVVNQKVITLIAFNSSNKIVDASSLKITGH
jgi:hypothetical protein